ncbi:MAG: DUF962 domain-containing protein [Deltaproteobacteria bacterium]|jgi:uncharacterized membrane protein YGL010W
MLARVKSLDTWLDRYGESHRNPTNKLLHWICIPLIVLSMLGMGCGLPIPGATRWIHFGTVGAAGAVLYYLVLAPRLALGMVVVFGGMLALVAEAATWSIPLWGASAALFVLAWVGQFIGHRIEGKKPSFFEDLQFLLIGPLWLLADLYRRVGLDFGSKRASGAYP